MKRPQHPDKAIEFTVRCALIQGWHYVSPGKSAHCWGRLMCPETSRQGCIMSVWSTPRNTLAHARQISRVVNRCHHAR